MNISLEVIPPRFLAAATLVLTLVVTAFTAGALALWCRWRSTTLAAFLKLDGRLDWRAVWQGLATGAVGLCLCDIVQLLCKLVLRSAVPQPPICSAVQQLDVLTYLLHSGDPLAVAMSFSTMVFAAPICEELIFRWVATRVAYHSMH
jgi:membrane protease YdiL (CAAX protease family)